MFSGLHPGTTYLVSVRARTTKGFGQTALTEITTNISGERLVEISLPVFVFVFFYFKTEENWDENQKNKKKVLISTDDGKKKKKTLRTTTKSVRNVLSHSSVSRSVLIEYLMPPNYTNYLHFPRRQTALAPSFDEIMVHLNYGGATSVPFVRSPVESALFSRHRASRRVFTIQRRRLRNWSSGTSSEG